MLPSLPKQHILNPVAATPLETIDPRMKQHPLYPAIEYIANTVKENGRQQKLISKHLVRLDQLLVKQKVLIEENQKKSFNLKDENLEVSKIYA